MFHNKLTKIILLVFKCINCIFFSHFTSQKMLIEIHSKKYDSILITISRRNDRDSWNRNDKKKVNDWRIFCQNQGSLIERIIERCVVLTIKENNLGSIYANTRLCMVHANQLYRRWHDTKVVHPFAEGTNLQGCSVHCVKISVPQRPPPGLTL